MTPKSQPEIHQATQTPPASPMPDHDSPALQNNAVARCVAAWETARKAAKARRKADWDAEEEAAKAYRHAMPPLCGHENIRDFIACVGYGMLIDAFEDGHGTRFLYAAQVALGGVGKEKGALAPTPPPVLA